MSAAFRNILFYVFLVLLFSSCNKKSTVPVTSSKAQIMFDVQEHDFGDSVVSDNPVNYDFVFHNTGATPLVIQKATTGCGCTEISYDKEPIEPGEEGKIHVTYLADNGSGRFSHFVAVYSNGADSTGYTLLHIEGFMR